MLFSLSLSHTHTHTHTHTKVWDTVVLERLDEACDPVKQAEVAAVVMQPGLANVCLLTSAMTIVRQRIDVSD